MLHINPHRIKQQNSVSGERLCHGLGLLVRKSDCLHCKQKLAAPYIEDVLLHVVNVNLQNYQFAESWKTQLIFPFFKKGDRTDPNCYRPVSHIVEMSKLVEYAVNEQVLKHFIENELFHPNHHGFLPQHSTVTALVHLYEEWLDRWKLLKIRNYVQLYYWIYQPRSI